MMITTNGLGLVTAGVEPSQFSARLNIPAYPLTFKPECFCCCLAGGRPPPAAGILLFQHLCLILIDYSLSRLSFELFLA